MNELRHSLLVPAISYAPKLEPGEELVFAAGLTLVFQKEDLVYVRCKDGSPFLIQSDPYRLLGVLARRPGCIIELESILRILYDEVGNKRPRDQYLLTQLRPMRDLRTTFKEQMGHNPIQIHTNIGLSLRR